MKVKLTAGRVGALKSGQTWAQNPGQVVDLPKPEAERLLETGQAEPVEAMDFAAPKNR